MSDSLDPANISARDPGGMSRLILSWPDQVRDQRRWFEDNWNTPLPERIGQFVVGGMGGSGIAGDIAYGVTEDTFPYPYRVVRDYRLPASVGPDALCLLSSYSGNTEETLALYEEAARRGCKRLVVTGGGELQTLAERDGVPQIPLPQGLPPRAALGYNLISVLWLLRSLGWPGGNEAELDEAHGVLEEGNLLYGFENPELENPAKTLARNLLDAVVVMITPARFLSAVGVRWKSQINENAKGIAFQTDLPEMNHNEIVGWDGRRALHSQFRAVFLTDREVHPRIARRIHLTRGFLEAEGIGCFEVRSRGESRLARVLSLVQFGDWVSFYLAILGGADPMEIVKLEKLKQMLKESS